MDVQWANVELSFELISGCGSHFLTDVQTGTMIHLLLVSGNSWAIDCSFNFYPWLLRDEKEISLANIMTELDALRSFYHYC